jgi:predicted aminopeptidase
MLLHASGKRVREVSLWVLMGCLAGVSSGCRSVAYYHQAALGQWHIERSKESIHQLLADPETPDELKAKFRLIRELRQFAYWSLKLPSEQAYDSYVALHRDYVVWNVTACPEYSMEPRRWWYPFLGRLKYRGYFDSDDAHAYARELKTDGQDVTVEGVVAYSTLGWFNDPVFDTYLDWKDVAIAELLFHELSHQKVFLSGETDWNEAFAVVTARAGVRAWLSTQSRWDDLREYEEDIDLEDLFIGMILETKADLESLYAFFQLPDAAGLTDVEKARQKQAVYDGFRERFAQAQSKHERLNAYAAWVGQPLNNARLSAVDTYYQWVPMFEKMLADAEGDWEAYYGSVKSLDDAGSRPGLADDL